MTTAENNEPEPAREAPGESRRKASRAPIHGVLVAIDAPEVADQPWVVDAIDINSQGLGLVLPPELPEGTEVLLSFRLDEGYEFSRMPATVLHRIGVSGGVRFGDWGHAERLELLEYLVSRYEGEAEG